MKKVESITKDGKVYYSIDWILKALQSTNRSIDPKKLRDLPNVIAVGDDLFINLDIELKIPESDKEQKDLGPFDKILSSIMKIPKR